MGDLPFQTVQREIVIRKEVETSPKFGSDIEARSIKELKNNGIINVNKPRGPTSHQVSSYVQNILGITKSGHSGTLDPNVTGVLPVALGRATRIVNFLLPAGKEYVCLMHLHDDYNEYDIRKMMSTFVGKIDQLPPIKSAVKRQLRQRKIYYIEILDIDGRDVLYRVGCQAGTYIRKLCHDMGVKMGSGAHMAQLIRTKAGSFHLEHSWTLQDLKDAYYYCEQGDESFIRKIMLPVERAVTHLPWVWVMDTTVDTLTHGADLAVPGIAKLHSNIKEGDFVAIMTLKNELVAVGRSMLTSEQMMEEKGRAIKTEKVFMDSGIYPRYVKH